MEALLIGKRKFACVLVTFIFLFDTNIHQENCAAIYFKKNLLSHNCQIGDTFCLVSQRFANEVSSPVLTSFPLAVGVLRFLIASPERKLELPGGSVLLLPPLALVLVPGL